MEGLVQDLRFGIRTLLKDPVFTAVAVITLALGIGVNTAVFNIVNAFLLRPLPVKDASHLVVLASQQSGPQGIQYLSYPDFRDYREQADSFTDMCGYALGFAGLSYEGRAERILVSYVTGNYFSMLGVQPLLGRLIRPGEGEKAGADPYVVLGYSYWKRRFGADPSIVGRGINVDGRPFTVVGVVPQRFQGAYFLVEMDAYFPLGMASTGSLNSNPLARRGSRNLRVLASLRPGITLKQTQASLDVIARRLENQFPNEDKGVSVRVFRESQARPDPTANNSIQLTAVIFTVLVGLVLAVASINVANIQLVRALVRQKELAVRAALGAGRWRLGRQVLTESVILAFLGGAGGLLVGSWVSSLFRSLPIVGDVPINFDFKFDWRVFGFVGAIALLAGLVVGLMPALRISRADVSETLREGGRGFTGTPGHHRLRNILVAAQIAGSFVVLVAAGLFLRSLQKAQSINLGFQPGNVLNVSVALPSQQYDEARGTAFYRELKQRIRALPGVESASLAFSVPMGYYTRDSKPLPEGQVVPPEKRIPVLYNKVDFDYFATLRIPMLQGRSFTEADSSSSTRVAIVNEFMARHFWPGQDPVGKRFGFDTPKGFTTVEVVGVAKDGKYNFLLEDPQSFFYVPLLQSYSELQVLQIRTSVPPQTLALAVQKEIAALDSNLPVFDVETMDQSLLGANGFFLLRAGAGFTAALGLLGLLLAVVGIYGVVSSAVSQRTHEIGIRMALGAQHRDILSLILGQGLGVVLAGVSIGLAAAFGLTRFLSSLLFGVSPVDPFTFVGIAVLATAVALMACHIPARRAARLDPMAALRYE